MNTEIDDKIISTSSSSNPSDDCIADALFDDDISLFRELSGGAVYTDTHIRPSYEQQTVINNLLDGYNVVVDSVSGSGKSTTVLSAAEQMPKLHMLQITYNSILRHEVNEKVYKRKITNLVVHTFHSLAVKYYRKDAHQDIVLRKILREKSKPCRAIPAFHVVFLDEAQDMTLLYYQFMAKFIEDMGKPIQLCILGDYKQGIYQFKGADIRFLTKATLLWRPFSLLTTREFRECSLTVSYRITFQMSEFINNDMLGEKRLIAPKQGSNVYFTRNYGWITAQKVVCIIKGLLHNGYTPDDIFILVPSVKHRVIGKIENLLVENGLPCFVSLKEGGQISEKMAMGKVVFSTFHSAKGRERKNALVLDFDQTYFRYYAKDFPIDVCPNTLYVACTRAIDNLFLFEKCSEENAYPLSFLKRTNSELIHAEYIDFHGVKTPQPYQESANSTREQYNDISPTVLTQFINESVMDEITPILDSIFVSEVEAFPELELDIPTSKQTAKGLHEDVSDLNGIAIPAMYFDHLSAKTTSNRPGADALIRQINTALDDTDEKDYVYLKKLVAEFPGSVSTPDEYLYLTNLSVAVKEKLYFRMKQIESGDYGWLSPEMLTQCFERMDDHIGTESVEFPLIEHSIIHHSMEQEIDNARQVLAPFFEGYSKLFRFSAIVDCLTEKTLWELKCTSVLSAEHQIQVALYAWFWRIVSPDLPREVRLFNIRTGEIQRLDASFEQLTQIMVALLKGKIEKPEEKSDEAFIDECIRNLPERRP